MIDVIAKRLFDGVQREGSHTEYADLSDAHKELWRCPARHLMPALREALGNALNAHLIEMKPDMDDSITGFNEAWDIMRKALET